MHTPTGSPTIAHLGALDCSGAPADTLVLSLGNPLRGDDGVGEAVRASLAALGGDARLPVGVALLDGGTAGLETALLLQGFNRVIIVDAADMGRSPGEWVRFTRDEVVLAPSDEGFRGTLHTAGLSEALALGEALGILPDVIVIYGVQPEEIGWQPGLSKPVQAAVPAIRDAVLQEIMS